MYDLFSEFFNGFDVYPVYREEKRCPTCKQSYSDFQKTNKLGCADCYRTFNIPISQTLKQLQGATAHTGKIPKRCASAISQKKQLELLKAQLAQAVKDENYELAAKLHKQIKDFQ